MADSVPTDHASADRDDRTARIEELLLAGLDYYFAGEHERAISVWTRVLFLDRGHARARAYIERARGAVAEHQRESEELVQRGMTAFDQGDATAARELLSSAIARGGPHDVALVLLDRLNRLGAANPASATAPDAAAVSAAAPARSRTPRTATARSRAALFVTILALGLVALYVAISFSSRGVDRSWQGPDLATTTARPAQAALPVPRSADLAMWRATALRNAGHLKEALVALDRIGTGDAAYADADRLRGEIQAMLLAGLPPLGNPVRTESR